MLAYQERKSMRSVYCYKKLYFSRTANNRNKNTNVIRIYPFWICIKTKSKIKDQHIDCSQDLDTQHKRH
jgi:hypothetical protein